MKFLIREREVKRYAVIPKPFFRKVGSKSFKWSTIEEAHIFESLDSVPSKFLTRNVSLKRRYILVLIN